ncbi:MAG: hypothetical protein FWG35_06225 [Spirochaetaceae bacterium]|nr:hypothetical protein [Spirochaetaceae bacterium]
MFRGKTCPKDPAPAFLLCAALAVFALSALMGSCAGPGENPSAAPPAPPPEEVSAPTVNPQRSLARSLARAMSREEKCAQILMIAVGIETSPPEDFPELIKSVPAGALLLLGYNIAPTPGEIMRLTASFQETAGSSGKGVPFLIAVDHEGGAVYRLGNAATRIPGAPRAGAFLEKNPPEDEAAILAELYRASSRQLSLLGFSLALAPVLEPLTAGNKEFLHNRSFGEDAVTVSRAGGVFIQAMHEGGVLAVGKHFPGTGNGDPHEILERFKASSPFPRDPDAGGLPPEVLPFRDAAAEHGLSTLMVSHVVAEDLDPALPVSLSAPAISWIREALGFDGIVLTDDVNMKALSAGRSPEEAAVMALAAGADMIMYLDERHIRGVHAALVEAVREGRVPEERLEEAVSRILEQKIALGLWEKSRALTEAAGENPPFAGFREEFAERKKEGDNLAARFRFLESSRR